MAEPFHEVVGIRIPVTALTIPRAAALAQLLSSKVLDHVALVECVSNAGPEGIVEETVIMDVQVERGQLVAHDIRHTERIAVVLTTGDDTTPEALALRPDFPKVPHLNQRHTEFPRCLCLYDQDWHHVSLRWTPASFVERIREWLSLTARGELHANDQPLEPLLFGSGRRLILPESYFQFSGSDLPQLEIIWASDSKDCRVLIGEEVEKTVKPTNHFFVVSIVTQEQTHGIIRHSPQNLLELHHFLEQGGVDLLEVIRQKLKAWPKEKDRSARLIVIAKCPLKREAAGSAVVDDLWAFMTTKTMNDAGISLGIYGTVPGGQTGLLINGGSDGSGEQGKDIPLSVLRIQRDFSRQLAAHTSGFIPDTRKVTAVGLGALGSQVVNVLARSGFGKWHLIDKDDLLPHNLGRHLLHGFFVGTPKAAGVAMMLDGLYKEQQPTSHHVIDVLSQSGEEREFRKALEEADLILDMSADVPVERNLALDVESTSRRISLFLNSSGTDLVLLGEDANRNLKLDSLEMQYYRTAVNAPGLEGHLVQPQGFLRYARSCGDVSAQIPNHILTVHSGIGAQAVRSLAQNDGASINIWRCDPITCEVRKIKITPRPCFRMKCGVWTLVTDEGLFEIVQSQRTRKLPNETGGVLLGTYDFRRKIIYIVDSIESPPDSKEASDVYIRGCEGLSQKVRDLNKASGGQLEYIGEWHSHPDGCACSPSDKDIALFGWLVNHLRITGQPALMGIICENQRSAWCINELDTLQPFS